MRWLLLVAFFTGCASAPRTPERFAALFASGDSQIKA